MTMQLEQVLGIINNLWQQIPQEYLIIFTFGGAGFALLNCFMGYRLRKVWGCLLGLLAGGAGGTAVGYYVLNDWVLALAAGAGCALIVCFLAWVFYKLGVFVMCTGLIYFMVITFMESPSTMNHLIALVIGVFAGTLALGYERQMVIVITALCGGIGGMGLLLSMVNVDSSAAHLLLGLVLAAFGAFVQSLPYMTRRNSEAPLTRRGSRGLPGRKKKVVKKTVHHRSGGSRRYQDTEKESEKADPKKTDSKKTKPKKDHFDAEDYDDEDLEEIYEAREKERQKLNMDRTQEYVVGQKQYERPKPTNNYGAQPGVGIDLDDLNRELSREIQKIYNDENSGPDN